MRRLAAILILACTTAIAAEPTALDLAFRRMYNFDFAGAHKLIDAHVAAHPDEPFGYVARGCGLLFVELDRMRILEASFLTDDERIADKRKPVKPDSQLRDRFFETVSTAQAKAKARLAQEPEDPDALFSMAISLGLTLDYTALIEKRQVASLMYARESQAYAARALRANPQYWDAYLTSGVSEYLLGSVPFFLRWFLKFDGVEGSKNQAIVNLRKVADGGRYLGPFARILLAVVSLREKRPREAVAYLESLVRDFPENPLLRHELTRLH